MTAYSKIEIVEDGCHYRKYQIRVSFIKIFEPPYTSSGQIFILMWNLSYTEYHHNKDRDLNQIVEVECYQVGLSLLCIVIYCGCRISEPWEERHLWMLEKLHNQSDVGWGLTHFIDKYHLPDHKWG